MKTTIRILAGAAAITAAAAFQPLVFGQASVSQTTTSSDGSSTTQTTTYDGTVSQFSPDGDTIVLQGQGSSQPMSYSYSKSTTIVDQNGNPVDVSVVKTGIPVHVFYDRDGDRMIARKIVVQQSAPAPAAVTTEKSTTTTTSQDNSH
jgi:hypothetical protein